MHMAILLMQKVDTPGANIYLFKVKNKNASKKREICSKLTVKTPERRHWHRSGAFIVNFEHISRLFLVFLLLILNVSWFFTSDTSFFFKKKLVLVSF